MVLKRARLRTFCWAASAPAMAANKQLYRGGGGGGGGQGERQSVSSYVIYLCIATYILKFAKFVWASHIGKR